MLKVFVPQPLSNVRVLPLLAPPHSGDNRLFQHLPFEEYENIIEQVGTEEECDAFLLPHTITDLRNNETYIEAVLAAAKVMKKRAILFTNQDDPFPLPYADAIIFRPSVYRSTLQSNEIILPALVEDLGNMYGIEPLHKGEKPTVGFVGKADFGGIRAHARYLVKNYLLHSGSRREGAYFRRRALALLKKDSRIVVKAIMRRAFGAHAKTIELPVEQLREEYLENIKQSLFTLAPRGDGNYSLRFYETLSLGRIPILIDTDMILPLEELIPYNEIILRVPYEQLNQLSDIVYDFWNGKRDIEIEDMQKKAREIFLNHLYFPNFLRNVFASEAFKERLLV